MKKYVFEQFLTLMTFGVFLFSVLASPVLSYRVYASEPAQLEQLEENQKNLEDEFRKDPKKLYQYKKQMITAINQILSEIREFKNKPEEFKEYLLNHLDELRIQSQEMNADSSVFVRDFDEIKEKINTGTLSLKETYTKLVSFRDKVESLDLDGFLKVMAKVGAVLMIVVGVGAMTFGGMGAGFGWWPGWLILVGGFGLFAGGIELWKYLDKE